MIKVVFFLLLWLISVGLLLLFGNDSGTFIILVGSVIFVALSAITLLVAPKAKFSIKLDLPDTCVKGESVTGRLVLQQPWWGAIFSVYCTVTCENTLTGEVEVLDFGGNRLKKSTPLTLQTSHCGALRVRVDDLLVLDPVGLFSRTVKCAATHHVVVPPVGIAVQLPTLSSAASLDSDTYSTLKAGMDVSETYAIREYQPGDPIRSIHWKLTEKLDKVMVREFGLPVGGDVLLTLDTSPVGISPAGMDAMAEMFFSASLALLNEGVPTTMGWVQQGGGLATHRLLSPADAFAAIEACLLTVDVKGAVHPAGYDAYAKVLVVTAGEPPRITVMGATYES